MSIKLTKKDGELVKNVKILIKKTYQLADMPAAVAKSISSYAVRFRNKGRANAIKRHPFKGFCEVSGLPLKREDAHLDELEPEKGYQGRVCWTCPKANNSGKKSCGKC